LACVDALAGLARREPSDLVTMAYGGRPSRFGPAMLIPRPFDPRLLTEVAPAVARAAMSSGVATRPIDDFDAYRERLTGFVFRSGLVMKPLFERARSAPKRVIYGEGEERRVLQAVQQAVAQGLARPILVGRPKVILSRIESLGLDLEPGRDFDLVNILDDARFRTYWSEYHRVMGRSGVSPDEAKHVVRSRGTAVAALAMRLGDADAMLCGTVGIFHDHLRYVRGLVGTREGVRDLSTMSAHILPSGTFFICDTHITPEPSAEEIVEMTMLACTEIRAFGMEPKVALLSRSNFGTHDTPTAERMRRATSMLHETAPELEVDGEMHADAALSESIRSRLLPDSRLKGQANLLVMPNVEAANIAHNLLRGLGGGVSIGPILVGAARSAHVVTQTITVRGLVNMTALAVAQVDAVGGARDGCVGVAEAAGRTVRDGARRGCGDADRRSA
ncbi:MAG: phosphate acyltransferase, partial [Gammaproteobacteria bacterium]|nr:phosphate acyltransferase [Gammaproteobacteria bacterium]